MKLRLDLSKSKINKDLDQRYIIKGEYRDLLNGRVLGSVGSNVGVLENMRGTVELSIPQIPSDYNVIGFHDHRDYLYYIATNLVDGSITGALGGTLIGRYNKLTGAHSFMVNEEEDSSGASNLVYRFDKNTPIVSMQVFEGLLIFCDNKKNEPVKLNIEKLLSNNSYYENENDIRLIKAPPRELTITGVVDSSTDSNFLKGEPFQFASRYIYEDGEISAISSYSATPIAVGSEEASIDGRIGFMMNTLSTSFRIAGTDNRFSSFNTSNISVGAFTEQAASIDINSDGTRVIAASRVHASIINYSTLGSPTLVKAFNNNTSPFRGGRWSGAAISGDGNTIIFTETAPGSNKDLIVYKASNPINSSTTMQEVHRIDSGDDQTSEVGRRICMSSGGNVAYVGHSGQIAKSEVFGNQGTWNQVVNLDNVDREGTGTREIFSICCSSDGSIVYALCTDTYAEIPDYISVFRSRNAGADWDEIFYNEGLNRVPTNIDCSSDGRIVAFVMSGNGDNIGDARIFISNNEGSSFSPRSSSIVPQYLTDVTVSTTGSFITAVGRRALGSTFAEIHQSSDFGETFTSISQTALLSNNVDYPIITSINNEVSGRNLNNIDNLANRVDIVYDTGNKHVDEIEILVRVVKTNRVFVIRTINKEADGLGDNQLVPLSFRNDGSYLAVADKDTNKLYDNVPLRARAFEITQNALVFSNYVDGRSLENPEGTPISANITATVVSNPLGSGTNLGLKTNSNNTYALVYYDDFNRSSSVLEGPDVVIPSAGSDPDNPLKSVRLEINHLAPEWATRYKIVRKPTLLEYDIIDGFDNAYVVNNEIFLEITSFTGVVPEAGDTMELFSEINTESSDDPYAISQGNLTVPILRYVDQLATGTQTVAVELSSGDTTTRVDSQSNETAAPVPRGRYIVISAQDLENYSNTDVSNETSRYLSSLFYIIRNGNIEDQKLFQEVPGVWPIGVNRLHGGDSSQTLLNPAVINLDDDYDIVWGQSPPREMFKYDLTTNLTNLGRANAVSDNFREIDRFASLIASEPFVDDTNFNGLSSFNLSLIPYKDLDKRDGQIQFVNSEDTNIEVYQQDKISTVLYRKNVLTTATGEQSVTQTEDIWGEQIRSTSEYGMSHPESYSEWGNWRYFVDAERGVVLRKSTDGLTEISAYGLLDFFHDILVANKDGRIRGYYEPKYNNYALVIGEADHLLYAERINGWETRLSFMPEKTINDGLDSYSYDRLSRKFYKHDADSVNMNRFYGVDYNTVVQAYFNDAYDAVKTVTALSLNGTLPTSIQVLTESQQGTIVGVNMEEKEGLLFSEAPLDQNSAGRDYQFSGIVSENYTGTDIPVNLLDRTLVNVGDTILKNDTPVLSLGICTEVGTDTIKIDTSVTLQANDMLLSVENSSVNGDELKGRVIGIIVTYPAGNRIKLNSVEIEVDESKQ